MLDRMSQQATGYASWLRKREYSQDIPASSGSASTARMCQSAKKAQAIHSKRECLNGRVNKSQDLAASSGSDTIIAFFKVCRPLGGILGALGTLSGTIWAIRGSLGASWALLGASWQPLGASREPLGTSWEPLGDHLGTT